VNRIFSLAFVLALTGAVTPGPMLALVIGQVLAQGVSAAVLILLGHALIECAVVLLLAQGSARILGEPRVRAALGLIGGAVLVWMGAGIVATAGSATLHGAREAALPWVSLILAGIGVSLSNPYFTGWWATVGSGQVATLGLRTRRDYLLFFVGHELGDALWYLLVAFLLLGGRHWLSDRLYQVLLSVCGLLILLLGGLFLLLAARILAKPAPRPAG
jgi:threonine/homoserine/homoserine lactone efflux protein